MRFRPDDQSGSGLAGDFGSLVKSSAQGGWKGLKTGGPWGLPNIPGGIRGAKRGAKRGVKDIINRAAKRKLDDLFGE